jgi:hypothetical protein
MKIVNVALDLPVHFEVDLDEQKITRIYLPSWLWSLNPDAAILWSEEGGPANLDSDQEEVLESVLENSPYPDPEWD